MNKKIITTVFLLTIFTFSVCAQDPLPEKPESWVNDYVNILTSSQKNTLDSKLQQLERQTSTQIFVAIFDKIPEGYYLEDFAVKLFDKWQPGRAQEQNGVLIVLFHGDRKIRIEVGYGLEGALTDLQAGRVVDQYMIPEFRNNNYFAGLNKGIDVIISAVKGEYNIPVKSKKPEKKTSWLTYFILAIIIMSIFGRGGRRKGTTISGRGSRYRRSWVGPVILGSFLGSRGGGGSSFGGGGFSGGFGGLSGGGGASGSW